jgi:hypothetical protein
MYTPLSTLIANELDTYHLLLAVCVYIYIYISVTFPELSSDQNLTSFHGLETAKCSAALVTYETQLMVVDDES